MSAGQPRDGFESSPVVSSAVRALRTFGGEHLHRAEAMALLGMWAHRGELTSREVSAVLRRFPPMPVRRRPADVCANRLHDHTTYHDSDGEPLIVPEPMLCNQCDEPAHFNYGLASLEHDDPEAADCFLVKAVNRRRSSDCVWRPADAGDGEPEPGTEPATEPGA